MEKSGWILDVTKVEPTGSSGIMDVRQKQNRSLGVSKVFSSYTRKNGVTIYETGKEGV